MASDSDKLARIVIGTMAIAGLAAVTLFILNLVYLVIFADGDFKSFDATNHFLATLTVYCMLGFEIIGMAAVAGFGLNGFLDLIRWMEKDEI